MNFSEKLQKGGGSFSIWKVSLQIWSGLRKKSQFIFWKRGGEGEEGVKGRLEIFRKFIRFPERRLPLNWIADAIYHDRVIHSMTKTTTMARQYGTDLYIESFLMTIESIWMIGKALLLSKMSSDNDFSETFKLSCFCHICAPLLQSVCKILKMSPALSPSDALHFQLEGTQAMVKHITYVIRYHILSPVWKRFQKEEENKRNRLGWT